MTVAVIVAINKPFHNRIRSDRLLCLDAPTAAAVAHDVRLANVSLRRFAYHKLKDKELLARQTEKQTDDNPEKPKLTAAAGGFPELPSVCFPFHSPGRA
jgi:hypothetical protein